MLNKGLLESKDKKLGEIFPTGSIPKRRLDGTCSCTGGHTDISGKRAIGLGIEGHSTGCGVWTYVKTDPASQGPAPVRALPDVKLHPPLNGVRPVGGDQTLGILHGVLRRRDCGRGGGLAQRCCARKFARRAVDSRGGGRRTVPMRKALSGVPGLLRERRRAGGTIMIGAKKNFSAAIR